jgi:Ca2+-transporting ATPase
VTAGPEVARGLTSEAARESLATHGPNELRREVAKSQWVLFGAQFVNPLVGLLLAACVVSALLGELANAIAIGVIVVVNAVIGYTQEARAERALLALRSMTAPRARLFRDGHQVVIPAAEVVPGDVLLLEAGDVVAADAVLVEAHVLKTNEAALTGESVPTGKKVGASEPGAPLAERFDRVFMGTSVSTGTGVAQVSATGMATELGKIAQMLEGATDTQTPLQKRLAHVGQMLLWLCLGVVAVVAGLGALHRRPILEVFMSAISLAVAVVPEGLPAVVTIALAIGVQRMAARNVLIRKLPAVETLGSATVICTDKTGTLTTGAMAVRETWGPDHDAVIAAAAACCDAELDAGGRGGTGDPTEVAILAAAFERGIRREQIEADRPRRAVEPFDPETRRMSVLRADGRLYVKGAFEALAPLCREGIEGAAQANAALAERGLRVLAVGVGPGPETKDLRLLGLLGIADPPRTEVMDAIAAARGAGIRTVMITGDHPKTAGAIAREMGIAGPNDDPAEVVHARATPEDKLRIVRDWKARGAVVAMTGDGVNDAPALREAHIGIAMGRTGTEVTREASDMVLADDNFASIVAAIREGRGIFDNIRKALLYLLTGNTGELVVMLAAAFAGLPLPLLPLHLLWINLVTDGLPALALVMDPAAGDAMKRPPRSSTQPMLGRREWTQILLTGALQGTVTLLAFLWALRTRDLEAARDVAFTTLVFGQIFQSFAFRSPTKLLWEIGPFSNMRLVAVAAASVLVQVGIHYVPLLDRLFQITPLGLYEVGVCLFLGLVPVTAIELSKVLRRQLGAGTRPARLGDQLRQ